METVVTYLPLLNALITLLVIPAWKLYKAQQVLIANQQKQLLNQKEQMEELRKMNKTLREEVNLLRELVFKTVPPEILQEHLLCHMGNNNKNKD